MTTLHVPAQRPGPASAPVLGAGPVPAPRTGQQTPSTGDAPELVDLGWRRILRVTTARAVLALVASLVIWSLLPLLAGFTPRVILSGSMEPRIHVGDVVVTREVPAATLSKGQVITVKDPDHHDRTRTHRLVRRDSDGTLVTKGDANPTADSSHVTDGDVLGLGVLRVPFVGRPAFWVAERNWLALGVSIMVLAWAGSSAFAATRRPRTGSDDVDESDDHDNSDDDERGKRRPSIRGSRRARQAAAVAAVAAVAVGVAVAPAEAAFTRKAANPVSTLAAATVFRTSYSSAVTVDAPQFFWRLGESSGSVADDAIGTRDGRLTGSYSWGLGGALPSQTANTAVHLDGGYIDQSASLSSGATSSVELWLRTTRTSGGGLMSLVTSSGVERSLYMGSDGRVRFGRNGTALVTSRSALNDGSWHHVVFTSAASGTTRDRLYVDGTQDATSATALTSATGTWRAGQASWTTTWQGTPDQFFRGDLDEVAVYTTTLSAAQVSAHYAASGN